MPVKNLIQAREALRVDLKDTAALWSNAELDRSIERAVSDLSRMLPLEKIYELSLQFTVTAEAFTTPLTTDADRYVAAQTFNAKVAGDTFTLTGSQPDHPRVVTMLVTDANDSLTNWVIIVKGTDSKGKAMQETFYFSGGKSQTGKLEFKKILEVELDQVSGTAATADVLDVGIAVYTTCWVELGNKPIKAASETASVGARNTDFYMDYANGRLQPISGGLLAASTAYTITYTKGQLWVDLKDLYDLIRVEHVIYPATDIPQSRIQWDIWGKVLNLTGLGESEDQASMQEDKQISVYYNAYHQPPTIYSPGSYPEFLDDTVLLAASAYALFIYALKSEHQAVTDFASARTQIAAISHTAFGTALSAAIVQLAASATALAKVTTYVEGATESTKALLAQIATDIANLRTGSETALDAAHTLLVAATYTDAATAITATIAALDKVNTFLQNNTNEDSKFWLTKITTDIANLRTAIVTALDALNTYADAVATDLTAADNARANYMGATANYVDGGVAPDIKKYLDDGDAKLDTVTIGGESERTPEMYAQYARATKDSLVAAHEQDRQFKLQNATARTNAALAYMQEAAQRLSNLRTYIEQADAWGRVAAGFVNEAVQRLSIVENVVKREVARQTEAHEYILESNSRMDKLRTYIEQSLAYARIAEDFVAEANQRVATGRGYIDEATARLNEMGQYLAEADRYTTIAVQDMALSDRFRAEANLRRDEAWSIWRDRKTYIGDFSSSATRQMPSYNQGRQQ